MAEVNIGIFSFWPCQWLVDDQRARDQSLLLAPISLNVHSARAVCSHHRPIIMLNFSGSLDGSYPAHMLPYSGKTRQRRGGPAHVAASFSTLSSCYSMMAGRKRIEVVRFLRLVVRSPCLAVENERWELPLLLLFIFASCPRRFLVVVRCLCCLRDVHSFPSHIHSFSLLLSQ